MKYKKSHTTKQHIVHSAIETINTVGIENASINKILKDAEVSKGGFYYYFNNFDDLMDEILMEVMYYFFEDFVLNPKDITKDELKTIGRKIINSSNDKNSMASIFFLFISKAFTDPSLRSRMNILREKAIEMEISNMDVSKKNTLDERFINIFDILVIGFLAQTQFTDKTDLLMTIWDELVEKFYELS